MMRLGRRLSRSWTSGKPVTPDRALAAPAQRTQPAFHQIRFRHLMSSGGYRSSHAMLETESIVVRTRWFGPYGSSATGRRPNYADVTYNKLALCVEKIVEMD